MRRSQRLRNKRLLGPGRGIDNSSAVASVMLARAGEHAHLLGDVASSRQDMRNEMIQNRSLADHSNAMYNLYLSQGNVSGAALAKKQRTKFVRRAALASRYMKGFDERAPQVTLRLNSVMEEVARHSAAFPN